IERRCPAYVRQPAVRLLAHELHDGPRYLLSDRTNPRRADDDDSDFQLCRVGLDRRAVRARKALRSLRRARAELQPLGRPLTLLDFAVFSIGSDKLEPRPAQRRRRDPLLWLVMARLIVVALSR